MARLRPEQRDFFDLVSRAAFSNPFGQERDALDEQLAETRADDPALLDRLLDRLRKRLDAIERRGPLDVTEYDADDRERIENAVLFEVFHRHADDIDAHIEAQLRAGGKPLRARFGEQVLSELADLGFEQERAARMLELFFQMRRAFFFVARGLVGRSPSMRRLRESLWNAVFTRDIRRYERFLWNRMEDFSTILLGETGTGKGAAAAAIGRSGFIPWDAHRRAFAESFTETLVPLNLSQFPEALIESELFGHKKGAFTGAVDAHEGAFSRCSPHGAIFLDEIGEVSIPVQIKLLRVLQERTFSPVGSHEERRFEGRVIAATHRPLDALRREGRFRDDFYYRLSSHLIRVPPLRERLAEAPEELEDLLHDVVVRLVGQDAPDLVEEARATIERDLGAGYGWPGNVRELEQHVRRLLLTGECVPDAAAGVGAGGGERDLLDGIRGGRLDARQLVARYCALLHARHGSYEAVARVTGLDRRTVKKHVTAQRGEEQAPA